MSNYTKTTNFGAKDTLPSGDSQKIIRGTEFDTEFNNIATAVATKLEVDGSNNLAISGTFSSTKLIPTGGTATGNGMYLPAANAVAISTNGTERLRIDSSGVASFASNPILSGGTANGLVYLDGSKVATSGSAVTFDGTNFATTGTASATKLIPTGGSATGNGLYLPAANTVALSTNGAERLRVDSSGNLGLGVTPSASTVQALQVPVNTVIGSQGTSLNITSNAYFDSSFKYHGTGTATWYQQASGLHSWHSASSGTAGNAITFTERMRLDASGDLGVGETSPGGYRLAVKTSGTSLAFFRGAEYSQVRHTDGTRTLFTQVYNNVAVLATESNTPLTFGTNNTERMRLDASGNLGLGATPSAWAASHTALQITTAGAQIWADDAQGAWFSTNTYASAASTYRYLSTTYAAAYRLQRTTGQHQWLIAPSGTAGNAITFTTAMLLDSSGNLGIGTTSPTAILHTKSSAGAIYIETTQARGSNNNFISFRDPTGEAGYVGYGASNSNFYIWNSLTGDTLFGTSNTERARIKSTGQFRFVPLSSDPAGAESGDVYYNSTSNKLKVYNGTAWVDLH